MGLFDLLEKHIGKFVVTAFLLLFVVPNMYTIVPAGHNKVADLFGDVRPVAYTEGFHLVNPLLSFTKYDLRNTTYTWDEIEVPSQDKLKSTMDVSVTFRVLGEFTPSLKQETGTLSAVESKYITPKVRSLMREAGKSVKKSQDFFLDETQTHLQDFMLVGLSEYLAPKGIIIEAVLFRDITLPEVVTTAVIKTKERQEMLEREKAQLQIAEQEAQQQVKQAEAREDAAVADANAKRTLADAAAYEVLALAEAQAAANTKLSRSVTRNLIDYNSIQKWNGAYPSTLLSGDSGGVILSLPKN